jgi:NADPH:quinone reductase
VLVRVHASALNRADLLQREGRYPAPPGSPSNILGMEFAGAIEDCGRGTNRWHEGDRVFGIVGGGANAEYVVTREAELARIPDGLSWEDAAAIPEAFITAHDALVTQAGFRAGERVLVNAVGSGVGLAAVQLVRALGGTCFGTARTADKVERARAMGLDAGLVVGDDPAVIVDAVKQWSGGAGVDVVLELVGGPYLNASIDAAALKGRIMLIGLVAGRSATLNLGTLLGKRLLLRGTVMRARSAAEKVAATDAFTRDVLPLLENGSVRAVVDHVFPLDDIRAAHELLESNRTFGKVVLRSA